MARRPPPDIRPDTFFAEWLPAVFAEELGGRRAVPDVRVRVVLDGEGGGAWDLVVSGGRLSVARDAPVTDGEPDVTVAQSVADWRAFAAGEPGGGPDLAPPESSPLDLLFLDAGSRGLLATVRGTVRFEVTGFHGRTWSATTKFGAQPAGPAPDAVITVDAETYARLLARTLAPPEAYFSGKVKLAGDTGLAMQLAMAMMPRFTSPGR